MPTSFFFLRFRFFALSSLDSSSDLSVLELELSVSSLDVDLRCFLRFFLSFDLPNLRKENNIMKLFCVLKPFVVILS